MSILKMSLQAEKNMKVLRGKIIWYIGFALKIPYQNKMLAVIMTNEKWR